MVSADEVDDLDCMPLINRRRKLLLRRPSSSPPAPLRRPAAKRVSLGVQKKLPGLPRGMKFDPSDEDLLWHLLAEVGKGEAEPHPFISEFIISLDENDGFAYFHPHKLRGIKQDGSVSYFFHRTFKPYDAKSRKCRKILSDDFGIARWHKIGKTKPVYMDGIHKGCKKIMVLYMSMAEGQKPEKTNWVMHQYHVGTGEDEDGGFVVSRVFYQLKSRQGDRNAQDLSLDIVEAVGTEVEPVVAPRSIEPESHAENPHSSVISSEASTQATYHDTRAEENDAHAGWRKPDNNDNLPIEDPKQGKIQPQFLLDSQQHGDNILTCDELLQWQSSCGAVLEMSKSSISDNAELGGNDLEKETNASSRPSVNLMNNINECIAGRVKDEIQPADAQFLLEECYVDSAEHDAANSMANPLIESPDSVISWSLLTVDQSSRSPNCLNNESLKASHCQVNQERVNILSYQAAAPEVKLPVVGGEHGHLNAKSQPRSSAFSTILVPLMAEPLEENYVSNVSETNVAMQYSTDISPDKGTAACSSTSAPSLSDAIVYPDYSSSRSSKPKQTQEWSHRCSDEACISEAKLCSLVLRPAHQNDNDHMSNSVPSVSPIEVKAEPWEESNTKCIPEENAVKLSSPSLSGHPTESSCTDTLCSSKANPQDNLLSEGRNSKQNISTSYITSSQTSLPKDVHHNSSAAKLLSTTISGSLDTIISKSSWVFNQCSAKYGNFQDNILSNRSNLQEKIDSICFDQASLHEIKFEAIDRLPNSVSSSCPVRPKLEFMESGLFSPCQSPSILPELDMLRTTVKRECFDELAADVIDHIPLRERMEMTASGSVTNLSCDNKMECSLQTAPPPPECGSFDSVNAKARHFSLKRKRKKTATDSVETALEEDAPGLLQVLLDRGITVEEIKLYGDVEDDAALPICCTEDSFEELETVITKLFSEGPSLFKFPSVRQMKGSKAVYCLACLISLIEQTRYLRFRQSPVEWGWCRDLQSFIFVFERHNRIVLERPEYGYATYFFELVGSLPIDWQIKRLVAAMKLPCCSRTILLENKPLSVGEDLTEGEARVLEEYGWMRNSGLGTMLNYCDRVVHDKKFERYSSEWRAKIGELLMRGHDSGRTVLSSLPKKVAQYIGYQNPEIKLEL